MSLKIGLDLGASRIKVSLINQKGDLLNFFIPNRVNVRDSVGGSGYIVEYNNKIKRIGAINGTPNMQRLKIHYQHLEDILLAVAYRIKKEMGSQKDQALTLFIETLLPPKQFFAYGKEFKKKIADIGVVEGVVNGENVRLVIEDVNVNCEGVALLNTLDFNDLSEEVNQVLVIDVGSSTIDLVEVWKEENTWQIGAVDSIEFGGTEMCKQIEKTLISKYKVPFKYDLLEKTMTYTFEQKEHSILEEADCLDEIVEEFKVRLNQFVDHRQYKVILAGDGSELLYANKNMQEFIPNATVLDKEARLYGNSMGALNS